MSNILLLEAASQGSPGKDGTAVNLDGAKNTVEIQATSYGTDGKIVLKGKSSYTGSTFKTLPDPNTVSGLAEYSGDTIINVDRLGQGWQLRADLEITTGTATGVLVVMSTN